MTRYVFARTCLIALLALAGTTIANAKAIKKAQYVEPPKRPELVNAMAEVRPERPECRKIRRRLWVEDQGWLVRQVSICS
jgi:hypothetical protein